MKKEINTNSVNPKKEINTNSVNPDETPQNVASHQGLHCLPR